MKKKIDHARNMRIALITVFSFALLVSALIPINGWVVGLVTVVIVGLPMTLATVIVSAVQASKKRTNQTADTLPEAETEAEAKAEAAAEPKADEVASEVPSETESEYKQFRTKGFVHLGIGLAVLALAITNLFIAQSHPMWTQMFEVPFWWIIAFCSSVSFVLSYTNFKKAEHLTGESGND